MGDKKRSGRAKKRKFCGAKPKGKKQDGGARELSNPTNASERKMSTNSTLPIPNEPVIDAQEGFILIDTSVLCQFIARIAKKCHQCGNDVRCTIDVGSKQGFAHRVCSPSFEKEELPGQ